VLLRSYASALPRAVVVARTLAVASIGAVFAALVALELGLRIADDRAVRGERQLRPARADPDVGHVYVPNFQSIAAVARAPRELAQQRAGRTRRAQTSAPSLSGVVRVLCVGDSFTACDQVDYPETWPAALEAA
jgi:hypothetical protein